MEIEIRGLRKVYPGGVTALQGLDLVIPKGLFGLIGPNGSGKTTLMRILATLLEPTAGEATIGGYGLRRDKSAIRSMLGYMPQDFGFYPSLTAYETLDYFALLCRIDEPAKRRERIEWAVSRVNLHEWAGRKVGTFSGGMKQRLGIAQALLNDPKLVIVDEPTSGLDPEERIRLRNLLAELAADRVIILSTHIVSDVASTAEKLAILHKGVLLFAGSIRDLLAPLKGKTWIIDVADEELTQARERYFTTGIFRSATGMQLRVVEENLDHPRGHAAEPTLDDAYVWTMKQKATTDGLE